MLKLDHLTLPVSDWAASRDWYVQKLGLELEFEVPSRRTAAVHDQHDFTIFLVQGPLPANPDSFALTFRVVDVHAAFDEIAHKGVRFVHSPSKAFWGYGAELRDPDGYLIRLWDEKSMKEG